MINVSICHNVFKSCLLQDVRSYSNITNKSTLTEEIDDLTAILFPSINGTVLTLTDPFTITNVSSIFRTGSDRPVHNSGHVPSF